MFLGKGKKNKTKKQNKLYNMIPKFTKFYEGNVPSVVYNTKFCFCVFFGREVVFFFFFEKESKQTTTTHTGKLLNTIYDFYFE